MTNITEPQERPTGQATPTGSPGLLLFIAAFVLLIALLIAVQLALGS